VFRPAVDGITDGTFRNLLRRASGNGTYLFTEAQLYQAYAASPWSGGHAGCLGCLGVIALLTAGALGVMALNRVLSGTSVGEAAAGLAIPFGLAALIASALVSTAVAVRSKPPDPARLERWVARWERVHGPLPGLIRGAGSGPAPDDGERDDVERVLIVDRDVLVDLFVRNGFDRSWRAVVVSASGYPSASADRARLLLQERSELPVVLVHDSTPRGVELADRLARSELLPLGDGRQVHDAGLAPEDTLRIKALAPLRPRARDLAVPLDAIPAGALRAGIGQALDSRSRLVDALDELEKRPDGVDLS